MNFYYWDESPNSDCDVILHNTYVGILNLLGTPETVPDVKLSMLDEQNDNH